MGKAKKDSKTIAITVRFATNDLRVEDGAREQYKACWDNGWAYIEGNKTLGIKAVSGQPFNSLEDVIPLIKEILRKQNVVMVSYNSRPRIMSPKRKSW
ncbi:MAG: hypothetical protein HQ547_04510 [Candidatus Omnitrophica bacterium]|nr:hypothetical protein [Candidatus Omnitrophota bacterium]